MPPRLRPLLLISLLLLLTLVSASTSTTTLGHREAGAGAGEAGRVYEYPRAAALVGWLSIGESEFFFWTV